MQLTADLPIYCSNSDRASRRGDDASTHHVDWMTYGVGSDYRAITKTATATTANNAMNVLIRLLSTLTIYHLLLTTYNQQPIAGLADCLPPSASNGATWCYATSMWTIVLNTWYSLGAVNTLRLVQLEERRGGRGRAMCANIYNKIILTTAAAFATCHNKRGKTARYRRNGGTADKHTHAGRCPPPAKSYPQRSTATANWL
ncbi:unnamed protein product [Ceratitis capitata]|uniref:(Mediterranean fruit fly) hypothetical protein n=1 Tax=Ceratitis capitata TaxID=7213 RepID=A0A811UUX9_CERCA|nr:unnamed protein product [Ceratitis capitata]